ncbi:L,D-transpeptidase [Phyllobacterium lublinensis]|jgi:lipoprotein-anchoring transpeptidase ErfK/SrfK|uniref:L,D-transpeptidase n=1 Tax=Phyllobacterium lublinensis TaxID=2875708 RepID=UPI001CCA22B3|nr:L,D-transpeptidase [Phyllobacterium sp. 2063]MBZ9656151.1 L,D-transpeptidase [Phyllobacterium sp. 2063]
MLTRRSVLTGLLAAVLTPQAALAKTRKKVFVINPAYQPQYVPFDSTYAPGTVIIDPRDRFLYLVEDAFTARRYGVGVGRAGRAFHGAAKIGRKEKWPRWMPTRNMIRRQPEKYARYADGVAGGAGNPLGARALYLYRNGRDTYYRIHGTNEPWTIGRAVSNGCIRMVNEHVVDLYSRVPIGARVVVV